MPYRDGYKTVRVSDINHIETENKTVYLRLNNGTSEAVNVSMDELEQQLNPDCFFRANRQFIVARQAVKEIAVWFGSRLTLHLTVETPERIVISKARVPEFKAWLRSLHPVE